MSLFFISAYYCSHMCFVEMYCRIYCEFMFCLPYGVMNDDGMRGTP